MAFKNGHSKEKSWIFDDRETKEDLLAFTKNMTDEEVDAEFERTFGKIENKDDVFWETVQKAAQNENSSFYLNCGEGREFETPEMKGEDLSGWLIPENKESSFSKEYSSGNIDDKWDNYYVFAIWHKNGNDVSIEFRQY